jgi:hypothetical protein
MKRKRVSFESFQSCWNLYNHMTGSRAPAAIYVLKQWEFLKAGIVTIQIEADGIVTKGGL